MNKSILDSTKKILGIPEDYTAFDLDIITHINSVFSTLDQIGVGPVGGFMIEDKEATWDDLLGTDLSLNSVKTYVFLKVKILFDPPSTSFHLEALKQQAQELEWRLNVSREAVIWKDPDPAEPVDAGV